MTDQDIDAWITKEHPSGKIDWHLEYERLLGILEQSEPLIQGSAAVKGIANSAIRCGQRMLEREPLS